MTFIEFIWVFFKIPTLVISGIIIGMVMDLFLEINKPFDDTEILDN